MNRKNFMKTLATATASTVVGSGVMLGNSLTPTENAPKSNSVFIPSSHRIKRGVTLYSYQLSLKYRVLTLEECLEEMANIGAYGLEAIGQAVIEGYPNPSNRFVDHWWQMINKYGIKPACYTYFHDKYFQKTPLSYDEMTEYLVTIFQLGKKFGFNYFRMLPGAPIPMVEKAIPYAEKLGVWMGLEIHVPMNLKGKLIEKYVSLAEKHPDTIGFIPDFGIFSKYPRPYTRDKQIEKGVLTREAAFYIEDAYKKGTAKDVVLKAINRMKPKDGDIKYIDTVFSSGDNCRNPKDLLPLLPFCKHVHAKFNEMTKGDEFKDTQIIYEEIIPVLIQGGFDGYLCSEYEGQRVVEIQDLDEIDEVRRQHVMLKRMLGS